ncbi:uncharacterized protein LOC128202638 [Mya arenaria]|uniref:uncharacterized protein LOC128202638 n=1 Tax=Mya arenaria TaxID=6604 RepID=UPI0022E0053C|nr:uncharacterized protein LOC128202638 [Mya arenaria]
MAEHSGGDAFVLEEPEREAVRFDIKDKNGKYPEIHEVKSHIKQVAESLLYHWRTFPIILPPSLTSQGSEKGPINYRDLFKAPTFDELEQVATDAFGNLKKLNDVQLKSVWDKGKFEVPSINFPGQVHIWLLSRLLQKGADKANESLLKDSALALRLLIISAKNRIISPVFSLSQSVKSWGRGFWKLLDLTFGMPSTSAGDIVSKIQTEHQRYLIAELDIKSSYRSAFGNFSQYLKNMSRLGTTDKRKWTDVRPPAIPYIYQTPKGQDIDLRLFNKDVLNNCLPVLSNILERESKGWYVPFRHKHILSLKAEGLTNEEISMRVNEAVREEYLRRVYKAILSNAEMEAVEQGIGQLLVDEAKAVILMKKATENIETKMHTHKQELLNHLKKAHPVKSRIPDWVSEQTRNFEVEFVSQHLWSAHEDAIQRCEEEDLHQTVYFLRRDLNFLKQREPILLKELEKVRIPNRQFTFSMQIWLPSNWVTVKVMDTGELVVPTVIGEQRLNRPGVSAKKQNDVFYYIKKSVKRHTSTRYPLWRWYNFLQRTWTWMWNIIWLFGIVVPWCSPVSLRALLFIAPFYPDKEISQEEGVLYPKEKSKTHTLASRLAAVWESVRNSRKDFESTPDRGFLGKSCTRHLNRFWNYVCKGVCGSVLVVVSFPILCVTVSACSMVLAITAPVWTPVVSLLYQAFCILVYDFDYPGNVNKISILLEAVLLRFVILGTLQPITAAGCAFLALPLVSLAIILFGGIRRGVRGFWDTVMYNIVIKSRARVPANDGFVARRISGPGLASNYFFQIQPAQALAALEATMESEELEMFKTRTHDLIEKPVRHFRDVMSKIFGSFSGTVTEDGVYKQLISETSNYRTDLTNKINQRLWRLNTGLSIDVKAKVKLPERQLKLTILQAAHMLEDFYPGHVISQLTYKEKDFWEKKALEFRDWRGLASQKLSTIFSPSFLVPLEATDSMFQLKVQHLNLGRYVSMMESTDVHDDLDVVTEVHSNTGEITTRAPSLDVSYFNPTESIVQTNHYRTLRRRVYPWSRPVEVTEFDKLQVPPPIPHPAVIAITVFNRESEPYALSFDDIFCHNIIKSIKSFKDFADPVTTNSIDNDLEPSTPENTVEPVSAPSHLAEQERSFSDDSSEIPTGVRVRPLSMEGASPEETKGLVSGAPEETGSVDTANDVDDTIYTISDS